MKRRHHFFITMLLGLSASAHATSLSECKKAHENSKTACQDAATGAKTAIDDAAASAKAATSGSDGKGQSNMGGQFSGASTTATNAVTTAKGTCTDEQKKCDDACDASKAQNQKEKPQISQEKQKCDGDIKKITDQLDASAGTTKAGTEGGDKTKDAAQGGGSPSSPSGGDKDKDKDTSTPATTPATADTSSTGSAAAAALTPAIAGTATTSSAAGACPGTDRDYLDENCVGELTARCKGSSSDTQCQLFNQRYCGGGGSGGGTSTGVLGTSGATLSQGAGLSASDNYCAGQNTAAFCNSNTSQCPSCCAQNNSCGGKVSQDCSADPSRLLASPSSVSTAGIGGGAGGGAGSSGGMLSVSSVDAAGKPNAKLESEESKLLNKLSTAPASGGGGGGGGSAGGGDAPNASAAAADFLSAYGVDLNHKPSAGAGAAGPSDQPVLAASVHDVFPDRRGDVFKIQSLVLKARCDAGLELNCPPKN